MMEANRAGVIPTITLTEQWTAPEWAILQRHLIDVLNKAAIEFAARYTRPDGTLIWREDWPGMDGSDDPYEGFMYLALLYAMGGSEEVGRLARNIYEGITWQWTEYGQIHREFDAYYDWMHHGEGYLYLYFLGLADPYSLKDRQRALRFAHMYTGDDDEAPNYDSVKKLIRSLITGSRGPRFEMSEEDWSTHREVLDDYPAPYEDIPGVDFASGKCPWTDDAVYPEILRIMNERMARGDVPLNLNATGLMTHAYLYTGDETLRRWVIDYVDAWIERAQRNGGIIPDNVGCSGEIGETMDGKWWGGYYGWRWPHGFLTIIEPILNGTMNALLLTGDVSKLELARTQLDALWKLGREEDGRWVIPHKHYDSGWTDFGPANPLYPIYLWYVTMEEEDLERVRRVPIPEHSREIDVPGHSGTNALRKNTKHYNGNWVPWFQYVQGERPDYPAQILKANLTLIAKQLEKLRSEQGDPAGWTTDGFSMEDISSIHKWQEMCPVYFEGLGQLTLGAPMHLSHGGLQHARVRYFDGKLRRPGLPEGVAALVEKVEKSRTVLELVNTSLFEEREVIVQAGGFAEHHIDAIEILSADGSTLAAQEVQAKWLQVHLPAGTGAKLVLHMRRYVHQPSYDLPWGREEHSPLQLKGRVTQGGRR